MDEIDSPLRTKPKKGFLASPKEWISAFSIALVALTGAYATRVTHKEYIAKKQIEEDEAYFQTLSYITSDDLLKQKAAIFQLVRFQERYRDITPILIDFLHDRYKEHKHELSDSIINAFILMEYPVQQVVKENINGVRPAFSQWVIMNFLKKNIGNRLQNADFRHVTIGEPGEDQLSLKNLFIERINLEESSFINVSFNTTTFSNVNFQNARFEHCEFWGTSFIDDTNLNNASFKNCYLKDCTFSKDLTKTSFSNCTIENIKRPDNSSIDPKQLTGITEANLPS